jgi:hypothetical protein
MAVLHRSSFRLLGLLCLSAAISGAWADRPVRRPSLAGQASLASWQAYAGETFEAWGGKGARPVENVRLSSVRELPSSPSLSQFTLHFVAAPDSALEKGVHGLRHPEAGSVDLWLDPAGGDDRERRFDARFSLLQGQGPTPPKRNPR